MGDGVSQAAASRVASAIAIWISRRRLNERRQVAAELHFLSAAHKAAVVIGCCWRRHRCMHLLHARLGQALARRHASLLLQTQHQASRTLQVQTPQPSPLLSCLPPPGRCRSLVAATSSPLGLAVRINPYGRGAGSWTFACVDALREGGRNTTNKRRGCCSEVCVLRRGVHI